MCVPNLSVEASGKGLCDVMGLHGWLDCPHCVGTWLSPVPLADVPMDTGLRSAGWGRGSWLTGGQTAEYFAIPGMSRRRVIAAAAAASLQSCPTLCNPIDGSPPGSSVPGILQARILEWVAISFSSA